MCGNGLRVLMLSKPDIDIMKPLHDAIIHLCNNGFEVYVEENVDVHIRKHFSASFVMSEDQLSHSVGIVRRFNAGVADAIDLIIAFGGDGLLMHCNALFSAYDCCIPPTMCFDFGSLGFLAPFSYDNFEEEVK